MSNCEEPVVGLFLNDRSCGDGAAMVMKLGDVDGAVKLRDMAGGPFEEPADDTKFGDVDIGTGTVDAAKLGEDATGRKFGDCDADVVVEGGKFGDIDFAGTTGLKFGDSANESVLFVVELVAVVNRAGKSGEVEPSVGDTAS